MDGLPRIGTLVLVGLVGACSQIIGLDKFDSDEEKATAGESGDSGKGGKGGEGGQGGSAGSATTTGGAAGSTAGTGAGAGGKGASGGTGGNGSGGDPGSGGVGDEGGMGPVGGKGGNGGRGGAGGTAGSGTSGDAGAGGDPGCSEVIEITAVGAYTSSADGYYASYAYDLSPQIYGPIEEYGSLSDYLWLDFYAGGEYTGHLVGQSFPLGVGEEENYASCSRCAWLGVDYGYDTDTDGDVLSVQYFFAVSGTLEVAANSDQMNGYPNATLNDVLLREVTINFDAAGASKIVPGGRCLHLNTASYTSDLPPVEWQCAAYAYGSDDGCDCGCGIIDPDCAGNAGVGACEYCSSGGTCSLDSSCHGVDLYDNSICTGTQPWTCYPPGFDDPYDLCDCGCGILDPDCPTEDAVDCDLCNDAASCTAAGSGTCADLVQDENYHCQ